MATLGTKAIGDIVKIYENGVYADYIVIHRGIPDPGSGIYDNNCNGTWLLRKECVTKMQWNSTNWNSYPNSTIHTWLNNDFYNRFDSVTKNAIKQITLKIAQGQTFDPLLSLSTKVFLLDANEVGVVGDSAIPKVVGSLLSYFISDDTDVNAARNRRIAYYNNSATDWWTRSRSYGTDETVFYINYNGIKRNGVPNSDILGIRPAIILSNDQFVADNGQITTNTAPGTPSSISVPSTITDGDTITVSWGASTDAEGNLSGYKLEKSTNGGSSWSQIYQGSARSKTDTISGIIQVMYRVKAYDSEGLESGYRTGSNIGIRFKPTAPSSISVPSEINDGQEVIITWGASTDTNGNLSGYKLEKSTNGGTQWSQIYQGLNLSYTDTVSGVAQVCYRVKAYDSTNLESNYATSQNVAVNRYPAITCSHQNNSNLGTKSDDFTVQYTITDADNNSVAVTENIDGQQHRVYTATLGQQNTFDLTGLTFMKLSNGEHTLQIIANDGKVSTTYTLTFTKSVTGASVTMKNPVTKTGTIMTCKVTILGNIPADAILTVEVTNNAKDENPVWENCTTAVKNGVNYIFLNKTAAAGYAFNFRVTVERGASNMGGYISEVSGKFA